MRLTLHIDGLAPGGEGVGRAGGRAVFVAFAAPGDEVLAEVPEPPPEGEGRGAVRAELLEVLAPGPTRRAPPCPHFGPAGAGPAEQRGCGGCEWLHVDYAAQLLAKERSFRARLEKLGGLPASLPAHRPIAPSPEPLRYRSRAKFHFARRQGRLVFFRRRSHQPVPLRECHLLTAELDALRAATGPALARAGLEPREVALEWSEHQRAGSAWLRLPSLGGAVRRRSEELLAGLPALAGLVLEAGDGPRELIGRPVLQHQREPGRPEGGLSRSRPDVFRQANAGANALLVRTALELLAPDGEEVLELFCGAGNFTGPLLRRARAVSAVEAQGPALDLARQDLGEASRAGGRGSLRLFAGDALAIAQALAREGRRFGAVLLDPPREGAKGIGPALRALGAPPAVYVSCDPATMARDLGACLAAGYRAEVLQPVDMFPQTHHVEGVALLRAP